MINTFYLLRKERIELKIIFSVVFGLYGALANISLVRNLGLLAVLFSIILTGICIYTVITICELPYIFIWFDKARLIKILLSIFSGIALPLIWVYVFLLPLIEILYTSTLTLVPILAIGILIYGIGIFFDLGLHIYMKKRGLL